MIELEPFDPRTMFKNAMVLVLGSPGAGKTTLCKSLLRYILPHCADAYVVNCTEQSNRAYTSFMPADRVHTEYDKDQFDRLVNAQIRKVDKQTAVLDRMGLDRMDEDVKRRRRLALVFDDVGYLEGKESPGQSKTIGKVIYNGRHYDFFLIMCFQYYASLKKGYRKACSHVFLAREQDNEERKCYKKYFGNISETEMHKLMDFYTENNGFIVVDLRSSSNDPRKRLFYYRPDYESVKNMPQFTPRSMIKQEVARHTPKENRSSRREQRKSKKPYSRK